MSIDFSPLLSSPLLFSPLLSSCLTMAWFCPWNHVQLCDSCPLMRFLNQIFSPGNISSPKNLYLSKMWLNCYYVPETFHWIAYFPSSYYLQQPYESKNYYYLLMKMLKFGEVWGLGHCHMSLSGVSMVFTIVKNKTTGSKWSRLCWVSPISTNPDHQTTVLALPEMGICNYLISSS